MRHYIVADFFRNEVTILEAVGIPPVLVRYYDNSHLCRECTGAGCSSCKGSGVERFPLCFAVANCVPPAIKNIK
jgi:hypothetical protein